MLLVWALYLSKNSEIDIFNMYNKQYFLSSESAY